MTFCLCIDLIRFLLVPVILYFYDDAKLIFRMLFKIAAADFCFKSIAVTKTEKSANNTI